MDSSDSATIPKQDLNTIESCWSIGFQDDRTIELNDWSYGMFRQPRFYVSMHSLLVTVGKRVLSSGLRRLDLTRSGFRAWQDPNEHV